MGSALPPQPWQLGAHNQVRVGELTPAGAHLSPLQVECQDLETNFGGADDSRDGGAFTTEFSSLDDSTIGGGLSGMFDDSRDYTEEFVYEATNSGGYQEIPASEDLRHKTSARFSGTEC